MRHDRDPDGANREAASPRREGGHCAAGRIEAKGRASGKDQGIDLFDGHFRSQQAHIAPARGAAEHQGRSRGGSIENQSRNPARHSGVFRMANLQAGNRDGAGRHGATSGRLTDTLRSRPYGASSGLHNKVSVPWDFLNPSCCKRAGNALTDAS